MTIPIDPEELDLINNVGISYFIKSPSEESSSVHIPAENLPMHISPRGVLPEGFKPVYVDEETWIDSGSL